MTTVNDLEKLGYVCGIASGSLAVEEEALALARESADPVLIDEQTNAAVADGIVALTKLELIPKDETERLQMFAQMGEMAFQRLTTTASKRVAFHERAVEAAKAMPDTWAVRQLVGDAPADGEPDTRTVVLQTYVSCKADGSGWDEDAQAQLDALADKDGYAERDYQGSNPEAMQAAQTLVSLGHACTRPKPGADVFEVDGATYSGADLLAYAEKRAAEPPPPTHAEKLVAALESDPGLSAATKKLLRSSLG